MKQEELYQKMPSALLPWYDAHKRNLPWRKDRDPYHIWVSEIMLQQTRVEAVKGYYNRFLEAVPTIEALSNVDDDQLLKLWEGLGYYSRVRNMKKAAQTIMERHDGQFPETYQDVLALPGIGEYTAGAICSIAFNQKTPAVDGNVLRVIARITDDSTPIDQPKFKKYIAENLKAIYPDLAGDFTQALMELGATICGPDRVPMCDGCPCNNFCLGCKRGTASTLPVKSPKKERKAQDMTVFILCGDGRYALEKRPSEGLLASLWQFPNTPEKLTAKEAIEYVEKLGLRPIEIKRQVEKKHVFTHVEWNMCGIYIDVANVDSIRLWLTPTQIREETALPTAFRQFWEEIDYV